jgi:hypothetical protein
MKKNFASSCEKWRERHMEDGILADVYDGQLWKDFQTVNGKDVLKNRRNYGFLLNFDFFQPMKTVKTIVLVFSI